MVGSPQRLGLAKVRRHRENDNERVGARGNRRSRHGMPGQVRFGRDDKGEGEASMESGC
jgi:hypothetical protein